MSKAKNLADAFIRKAQTSRSPVPARSPINAFHSLFAVQDLDEQENRFIERILVEGYEPSLFSEEGVGADVVEIKRLTKELKAIKKQELILIGERIAQARDIFKKYKEQSFREWIGHTFGSFKTGYNYLAFYDLYLAIPDTLKERLKEMPAKAVYVLASKKAPVEQKIQIVKEHGQETAQNLISLIQTTLGSDESRNASVRIVNDKIINILEKQAIALEFTQEPLNEMQKARIQQLIERLNRLMK